MDEGALRRPLYPERADFDVYVERDVMYGDSWVLRLAHDVLPGPSYTVRLLR